jgi:hypothetical protein
VMPDCHRIGHRECLKSRLQPSPDGTIMSAK